MGKVDRENGLEVDDREIIDLDISPELGEDMNVRHKEILEEELVSLQYDYHGIYNIMCALSNLQVGSKFSPFIIPQSGDTGCIEINDGNLDKRVIDLFSSTSTNDIFVMNILGNLKLRDLVENNDEYIAELQKALTVLERKIIELSYLIEGVSDEAQKVVRDILSS